MVFKISGLDFGLDIRTLDGIMKPLECDINFRDNGGDEGRVVFNGADYLITDFASLFGKKESVRSDKRRLLLIEYMEQKLAFHVDEVTQIITTGAGSESDLEFVVTDDTPNVSGYYQNQTKKLWQLDFNRVIGYSTPLPGAV